MTMTGGASSPSPKWMPTYKFTLGVFFLLCLRAQTPLPLSIAGIIGSHIGEGLKQTQDLCLSGQTAFRHPCV